jgi:hypothetical protein
VTAKHTQIQGIEGLVYTPEAEDEINHLVSVTFGTDAGRRVLEYLRNITFNRIHGPEVSDSTLRHAEGSRFIVAVLESRIAAARKKPS